jgi:hypothetical protein
MAKIPISSPDSEDSIAEKHVAQIMGPPPSLDGSRPEPITEYAPDAAFEKPVSKDATKKVEAERPASSPVTAPEVPGEKSGAEAASEPTAETSVSDAAAAANAELEKQMSSTPVDAVTTEGDLDMSKPPEEFSAMADAKAPLDDAKTAAAVDDILHSDADAALGDVPKDNAVVMKHSIFGRAKNAWLAWWDNPWSRYGTIVVGVLLALLITFVRPVHDLVLNTFGVRSSVTASVLDSTSNLPLQNALISVDGVSAKTNADGVATVKGVKLGAHDVQISKLAFATTTKKAYFGMRIVDLGDVTLKATGSQLTYNFTDYLSGKPVADVAIASGEATAKSDKKGKAIITIPPSDAKTTKITLTKDDYRTETLETPNDAAAPTSQKLVPSARAIFISKESGKYDVYKMYVDGKDRQVLLPGTGLETQSIVAMPSPKGDKVVVASTRDDKRNNQGYLLTALNIVDTETGDSVNIDYAEQVTLLGWRDNTIVYLQTVAGVSAANPARQKIIAYDLDANKRFQLANANYFAGQELTGNTLYYTVSATDPAATETFAKVGVDGTGKRTLYSGNVWSLLRTDYNKMKLQTPDKWYEYTVGANAPIASTPLSEYGSRYYVDSPDGHSSARVDLRDNKGVLLLRNLDDGKETTLTTQKNMQAPSYWLNNSVVVYRVSGAAEVADYAVSINGGAAVKIADVSLTGVR